MNERAYYGHESQLFGVEEYRLTGGKGDGMRLLQVRNGKGLDFTVSADRCADISTCISAAKTAAFSRRTATSRPLTMMTRKRDGSRISRQAS